MRLLPTAVVLAASLLAVPPSHAQSVNVFTGNAQIDCFGCGAESDGYADLSFVLYGDVSANFRAFSLPGSLCPVYSEWDGQMYGGRVLQFHATIVGAAMLITGLDPAGDVYMGVGTVIATSITCGAAAQFNIAGAFVGT